MALLKRTQPTSLTAAGSPLRVNSYEEATNLQLSRQPWTDRAWGYYENVGEVRYAANFVANSLSRLKLIAAKTPPPTADGWEPVKLTGDGKADAAVADAVQKLRDPRGGQRGLLRSLGLNLFVPGEAFLLGGTIDGVQMWECLSSDEMDVRTGYPQFYRKPLPSVTPQPIPADTLVIRIWKEHPRWSQLADSAMRTVLDQCETLLLLTRMERAAARSRFAGSGILFVPQELLPSGSRGEADTEFYANLMESMIAPIKDESHPSSVVPILLTGPADYGKAIQHITMDRVLDGDGLVKLKEDAVKRLAAAFDLPSEVLTGNTDLNHWGMAVVREETFAAHIQPFAEMVVDALTAAYLHPALRRAGIEDWEQYQIWFDKSGLVAKADQFEQAMQAHDRIAISDEALRRAGQFTEDDKPDEEEYKRRVGVKLVDARMAVTGELPPKTPDPMEQMAAQQEGALKLAEKQAELKPAPAGGEAGAGGAGRGRRLETVQSGNAPKGARAKAPTQKSERRVSSTATTPKSKPGDKPRSVTASLPVTPAGWELSLGLAKIDTVMLAQLQALVDTAIRRTYEKAGAKVRSRSANNEALQASIDGVHNRDVLATLGEAVVGGLGFDATDLIDTSAADMDDALERIIRDSYEASLSLLGELADRAGRERSVLAEQALRELMEDSIVVAKRSAWDTVRELAHRYVFKSNDAGDPVLGEMSALMVQPGDVRPIMVSAGGGSPTPVSPFGGGVATGRTVIDYARSVGAEVDTDQMVWTYGSVPRRGFQSHMQLDGAVFSSDTDPVLEVWPEDQWLRVTHYHPGDHRGCACVVAPYVPKV